MSSSPTGAISVIRKKENYDIQRKMRACPKSNFDFRHALILCFYAFLYFFIHIANHPAATISATAPIA